MEHLAIMSKGYIEKILSGEKSIESRFSVNRISPFGKIKAGEKVYLKETGKPVSASFEVERVLFLSDLDDEKIKEIRAKYGKQICVEEEFWQIKQRARYATLIFVKNPKGVNPFKVEKSNRSAFMSVSSIKELMIR